MTTLDESIECWWETWHFHESIESPYSTIRSVASTRRRRRRRRRRRQEIKRHILCKQKKLNTISFIRELASLPTYDEQY